MYFECLISTVWGYLASIQSSGWLLIKQPDHHPWSSTFSLLQCLLWLQPAPGLLWCSLCWFLLGCHLHQWLWEALVLCSVWQNHVPGPECGSSRLSNTRTSRVCSSLSSRRRVRGVKSFTSLENSSMRKKNELKPFWDEHAYFLEHWLESLAICTSNSCRILLGRKKCILHDVMPCDSRLCVETVGNRQARIYCKPGTHFPISCTMLEITSLWFVRAEE